MSNSNKRSLIPNTSPLKKGYHPHGSIRGGHQPTTGRGAMSKPHSNPPNKGSGRKEVMDQSCKSYIHCKIVRTER